MSSLLQFKWDFNGGVVLVLDKFTNADGCQNNFYRLRPNPLNKLVNHSLLINLIFICTDPMNT